MYLSHSNGCYEVRFCITTIFWQRYKHETPTKFQLPYEVKAVVIVVPSNRYYGYRGNVVTKFS